LFKATYHRDERLELSIRATTAKDVGDAVALSGQVFVHKTQNKLSAQIQIISVWYFESHMLRPADSSRASTDNLPHTLIFCSCI